MCDTLVAVGPATVAGSTLFAKNSDRRADECQPFVQLPAMAHAPGSRVRCTHVEIPQVSWTHAVMGHSPWWVWGFEHGVNEHGVAIGNELVFSKEELETTPGLIGMDLVRLGLERGRTAREALVAMASLLEEHGQGGPAFAPGKFGYHNGFLMADPDEAWVMQTSNRRWAAQHVSVDAISNHISLSSDWELGSPDVESFARARGWWTKPTRVDLAAAYRHPKVPGRISEGRLRRSQALLGEGRKRLDTAWMQRVLRDHLDGGPVFVPGATPDEERYFTLCAHNDVQGSTTASLVATLPRDRRAPWPVWISFATPCTGVFLPVYLDGVIPAELARGGEKPEADSIWWLFKELQDEASHDFASSTPQLREGWNELEQRVEEERAQAEAEAREAFEAGRSDRGAEHLSDFMRSTWRAATERARDLRTRLRA
jgi:dipeptidase